VWLRLFEWKPFYFQKGNRVKHPLVRQNLKDGKDGISGEIRQAGQTFGTKERGANADFRL